MDAVKSNLTKITNPDNTFKQILYEDSANPHAVTGIVDEVGVRVLTIAYDPSSGQVTSFQKAGGAEQTSVTYPNATTVQGAGDRVQSDLARHGQSLEGRRERLVQVGPHDKLHGYRGVTYNVHPDRSKRDRLRVRIRLEWTPDAQVMVPD